MTLRRFLARGGVRAPLAAVVSIIALTLCSPAARAQETQIVPPEADALVAPEVFPVFPWDILPATKSAYEEARACGFNLAGFVHVKDLDTVRDAGMKGFVGEPATLDIRGKEKISDEEIAERVKKVAGPSAKHPAVFGYHVIDEPAPALVPTVAKFAKAFQAIAPGAVAYTNFFPMSAAGSPAQRQSAYEQYLTGYLDEVKPRAFSLDHYSVMDDGTVRPSFFEGLEVVRRTSLKTGVPFWNVVLANSHFRYAEPTPATLRFQAFASLAYGARGIGWFTYTGRDRGNYRHTAIDLSGRKTPTWDMLRDVNLQLHRLAPTVVKLTSVNVFHHPQIPVGCRGIESSRFLADVKGTGPFLVGEFEGEDGKPAVIVVNRDLSRSTQFEIAAKEKATVMRVSSLTGKTRAWGAEDNWLAPGGGILLMLQK
jgi:hypothetical protein